MIRLLRRRPIFAFTALASFALAGVSEARALDPCLHHDGLPAGLPPQSHDVGHAATSLDEHAAHQGVAPAAVAAHDTNQPSEDGAASHEGCSCLGLCDAGASAPIPASSPASLKAGASASFVQAPPAAASLSHRSGGLWLLHLPNAPPLSI
jgi:hypothetical protein